MLVTRIAYSQRLNTEKLTALTEQAKRLGAVRSEVWQRYGSMAGVRLKNRQVRDTWMASGHTDFGVCENAWKETLADAMGDIKASREAAKVKVHSAIWQRARTEAERKRLFTALKADTWPDNPYLSRLMRKNWHRGHNHTANQIVVRSDNFTTRVKGKVTWLAIPGLIKGKTVKIPLATTVAPSGRLRLIIRDGRVEVHYQVSDSALKSSARPHGDQVIGVDKGYTEVLTDSDGVHHGPELGKLLTAESDRLKLKNQRRAKLRSVAKKATEQGDHAKAARIIACNLGTVKKNRARRVFEAKVRTLTFTAVHNVVDKAAKIAAEDLTKTFSGRKKLGKDMNRRLAAWTKGLTAEALKNVSERRGSVLALVNAAYTSQVNPNDGTFGRRQGDWLYCSNGDVWQADHSAAINVLQRLGDPDITLFTQHVRVKQILQERIDRQAGQTAGPGLQLSSKGRRAKYPMSRNV